MPEWRTSLTGFLDRAWREIEDFKTPRSGLPGLISLATITENGQPEIRTVVMRRVDRAAGTIEAFTDSATPKVAEIKANPSTSVLIWQPECGLQIRLRGTAKILDGKHVLEEWANIPDGSRKNYGVTPIPGTEIATPDAYERIPVPTRLTNLQVKISEMDVVHLDRTHDIRAVYRRADGWAGHWLAP